LNRQPGPNLRDARALAQYALTYRHLSAEQLAAPETRYSVLYCLIIIGEALNDIPPSVQSLAPDIKWRQIIDMRHILVHAYWRTDYEIVHEVLERDLDPFIAAVDRLLDILDKS
jgi:uncharacterized protein with HEPN domain